MKKFSLLVIAVASCQICFSQVKDFRFRRTIAPVDSAGWYSLVLPNQLFKNLNSDFSDLRIYQFSANDTIEAPYMLTVHQREITEETYRLGAFNQSKRNTEQYFTFELPKETQVNFIELVFNETNFDGSATIEGSNDQREWFEVEKNQRIISIVNQHLNFYSGDIHFGLQRFRYLRVKIDADKTLTLKEATFKRETIKPAIENKIDLSWKANTDKKAKQTIIDIELKNYQPIVSLFVETDDKVDYYRSFHLEKVSDSTSTPKGWQYYYSTIASGFITSLDSNRITFSYALAKKLRIVIDDADNTPLTIKSISLFSPQVELVARMKEREHFLYYGNKRAYTPSYDLVNFKTKIPSTATPLVLGEEEKLSQEKGTSSSLLENRIWLWILMGVVIAMLGFFTVRMMKEKQ